MFIFANHIKYKVTIYYFTPEIKTEKHEKSKISRVFINFTLYLYLMVRDKLVS